MLRYEQGQEYKAHNDNCKGSIKSMPVLKSCQDFLERAGGPKCGKEGGGPSCGDRIATFIIVLDPPEEGGHTAFPLASATQSAMVGINPEQVGNIPWYCSAKYQDKVLQVGVTPNRPRSSALTHTRTHSLTHPPDPPAVARCRPPRETACSSGTMHPTKRTRRTPSRSTAASTAAVPSSRAKSGS